MEIHTLSSCLPFKHERRWEYRIVNIQHTALSHAFAVGLLAAVQIESWVLIGIQTTTINRLSLRFYIQFSRLLAGFKARNWDTWMSHRDRFSKKVWTTKMTPPSEKILRYIKMASLYSENQTPSNRILYILIIIITIRSRIRTQSNPYCQKSRCLGVLIVIGN